jgi:hypothetical protein
MLPAAILNSKRNVPMTAKSKDLPNLAFPRNDAGERDGLNDAGIETFRDAPYASCAREAGQNSRDAASGSGKPVRLKFDLLELERNEIPSIQNLEKTLHQCFEQAYDDKEKEFFANAIHVVKQQKIPVLRIADYNTKGLIGPPDKFGTPFNSLLKARGVSSKDSATSGGSFGIGKNASVAVSELQTVFYSTRYLDNDTHKECFAAQGKVILVSHEDEHREPRRATGYWGISEGFGAITDESLVPSWMRREEIGTSIFSIGFRGHDSDWEDLMVCSLISNFFSAIRQGQMEFMVADRAINANTLESLLDSDELLVAAAGTALKDDLLFARVLHRCLASDLSVEEQIEISNLGKIRVRILADKALPRRVGFVRNGMLITDNLSYFGHKFSKFPSARDFICLVEPDDENAGRLLKSLENPQHKDFSADRIPDPKKRQIATKAMQVLGQQIRTMINSKAGVEITDSVVIEELANLFGEGAMGESDSSSSEKTPEKYIYEVVRQTSKTADATNYRGAGSGGNGAHEPRTKSSSGRPGSSNNGKKQDTNNDGQSKPRKRVPLIEVRNKITNSEDESLAARKIYFTSPASGCIELSIQALGINDPEPLTIVDAYPTKPVNGVLKLDIEAGERQEISIFLDESYVGPIEVIAILVSDEEAEQ